MQIYCVISWSFALPSRELKPTLPLKRDKSTFSSKSLRGRAEIKVFNRIKLKMFSQPLLFGGELLILPFCVSRRSVVLEEYRGSDHKEMRGNI